MKSDEWVFIEIRMYGYVTSNINLTNRCQKSWTTISEMLVLIDISLYCKSKLLVLTGNVFLYHSKCDSAFLAKGYLVLSKRLKSPLIHMPVVWNTYGSLFSSFGSFGLVANHHNPWLCFCEHLATFYSSRTSLRCPSPFFIYTSILMPSSTYSTSAKCW